MQAVGHTVLNRVAKATWYGRTISDVCLRPLQYSCWNHNDPNLAFLVGLQSGAEVLADAVPLARGLAAGNLPDLTHGATHYHTVGIKTPQWAKGLVPCCTLGRHVFYNDVD